MNLLEAAAVALGIVSVYLSIRQNIWSWPTAIANVLLYTAVFHGARLYADMGLQVVYAVINGYGWYQWERGGAGHGGRRVTRIPRRTLMVLAVTCAAGAFALGAGMRSLTDASLPYLDATLSSVSLAAQWMLARKYLENWVVWVALDAVYVPMFIYKALYLTAGLYAVFLLLSVMGWRSWKAGATSP